MSAETVVSESGTTTDVETIEAAAIFYDGVVYSLPRPARHCDVTRMMAEEHGLGPETMQEQGFVTSRGRWVRRKPAFLIAEAAGQILKKTHPSDTLFSEDVW